MRNLLLAATAIGALALAPAADAAVVLTFGQVSQTNTITATDDGTFTTISAANVGVNVTQILGGSPSSNDFLNLTATSVGAAQGLGTAVFQHFNGTFTISTGPSDTGTNLLSGSFTDLLLGTGPSAVITVGAPPDTASFSSSIIPLVDLGPPVGIALSFANVTPGIHIDGTTLGAFSSSVSGTFSANLVPEPAGIALLGVGLLGLGFVSHRRRS